MLYFGDGCRKMGYNGVALPEFPFGEGCGFLFPSLFWPNLIAVFFIFFCCNFFFIFSLVTVQGNLLCRFSFVASALSRHRRWLACPLFAALSSSSEMILMSALLPSKLQYVIGLQVSFLLTAPLEWPE